MPESEHPSLSGIDLSQLSEEELIDAIASAHEEELTLESNDKGDAESPFENETEAEEDIDPFPREEVVTLESWCTAPHGSGCTRCQAVCPTGALSLENGTPHINTELCTRCGMCAAVCPMQLFKHEKNQTPQVAYPEECWHCNACVADSQAVKLRLPLNYMVLHVEASSLHN